MECNIRLSYDEWIRLGFLDVLDIYSAIVPNGLKMVQKVDPGDADGNSIEIYWIVNIIGILLTLFNHL